MSIIPVDTKDTWFFAQTTQKESRMTWRAQLGSGGMCEMNRGEMKQPKAEISAWVCALT